MLDLEAIKARLAAATPGPWRDSTEWCGVIIGRDEVDVSKAADAAFIAAAPADVAALLAEVERLREALRDIEDTVADDGDWLAAYMRRVAQRTLEGKR